MEVGRGENRKRKVEVERIEKSKSNGKRKVEVERIDKEKGRN